MQISSSRTKACYRSLLKRLCTPISILNFVWRICVKATIYQGLYRVGWFITLPKCIRLFFRKVLRIFTIFQRFNPSPAFQSRFDFAASQITFRALNPSEFCFVIREFLFFLYFTLSTYYKYEHKYLLYLLV